MNTDPVIVDIALYLEGRRSSDAPMDLSDQVEIARKNNGFVKIPLQITIDQKISDGSRLLNCCEIPYPSKFL